MKSGHIAEAPQRFATATSRRCLLVLSALSCGRSCCGKYAVVVSVGDGVARGFVGAIDWVADGLVKGGG